MEGEEGDGERGEEEGREEEGGEGEGGWVLSKHCSFLDHGLVTPHTVAYPELGIDIQTSRWGDTHSQGRYKDQTHQIH